MTDAIAEWHSRVKAAAQALDVALRGELPLNVYQSQEIARIRSFVYKLDSALFEGFSLLSEKSQVKKGTLTLEDLEL